MDKIIVSRGSLDDYLHFFSVILLPFFYIFAMFFTSIDMKIWKILSINEN